MMNYFHVMSSHFCTKSLAMQIIGISPVVGSAFSRFFLHSTCWQAGASSQYKICHG